MPGKVAVPLLGYVQNQIRLIRQPGFALGLLQFLRAIAPDRDYVVRLIHQRPAPGNFVAPWRLFLVAAWLAGMRNKVNVHSGINGDPVQLRHEPPLRLRVFVVCRNNLCQVVDKNVLRPQFMGAVVDESNAVRRLHVAGNVKQRQVFLK